VKSTTQRLNEHDRKQIEAMLSAIANGPINSRTGAPGAAVLKDGVAYHVDGLKVTFIDPRGALGSVEVLAELLNRFKPLTLEVFDANGITHRLKQANLQDLQKNGKSLHDQLERWTRP
jgi:hypothetical protein